MSTHAAAAAADSVAYYRVSTAKQGEGGLGLEGQLAAVEAFAAGRGRAQVVAPLPGDRDWQAADRCL